ncbi:hypothetical protein ACFFQF_06325 [Haladaptatus pallidirubidus]|uniref:Uncharacterized protein n=1 Tax=Haladaptatus pallidirubidus TaxID=1008152 RepID=A0AAV3UM80_9EURY|nr:hypothetical protein [Haladaptatus pallidirubidus]
MSVDRQMVEHLVEEINKHDVDPSELIVVKKTALKKLQKENEELRGEIEGETEELSSGDSRKAALKLIRDHFENKEDDEEDDEEEMTEREILERRLRHYRGDRSGAWSTAADRVEEELASLDDEDREVEELSDPSPKAMAQSRQEAPQEDDSEDEMTPREKLDAALRRDIHDNKTEDMSKSPLAEAHRSTGETEELSGGIEQVDGKGDDDEMSAKERLVEALRQDREARE